MKKKRKPVRSVHSRRSKVRFTKAKRARAKERTVRAPIVEKNYDVSVKVRLGDIAEAAQVPIVAEVDKRFENNKKALEAAFDASYLSKTPIVPGNTAFVPGSICGGDYATYGNAHRWV